ncbi:MAG: dockerin type I domain-containing protein [Candidatus Omnitrophota bacterium]
MKIIAEVRTNIKSSLAVMIKGWAFLCFILGFFFINTAAQAIPAYVQSANTLNLGGTPGTTISTTLPSIAATGDLIAVYVAGYSSSGSLTGVTDSCGNTYTLVPATLITSHGFAAEGAYAKNIKGGSRCRVTATFASPEATKYMIVQEIRGVDPTSPLDGAVGHVISENGGTNAITSGNFTTHTSGDYIFGATANVNGGSNLSVSAGTNFAMREFNNSSRNNVGLISEDQIQTTASPSTQILFTSSAGWQLDFVIGMAFKPNQGSSGSQPPGAPGGLTVASVNAVQINLSWNASADGSGSVAGYYVYRNNSLVAETPSGVTAYSDNSVLPDTAYSYNVSAYDIFNNVSAISNTISVTTPEPPAPIVIAPINDSQVLPANREYSAIWSHAGVMQSIGAVNNGAKGIPNITTIGARVTDFHASGSAGTTTGSVNAGSNQLIVASPIDFAVNQGIWLGAGQYNVQQLQITSGAATAGNITVTLPRSGTVSVAVSAGDSAATVANKISAASFYSWKTAVNSETVIFTKTSYGNQAAGSLAGNTTGVAGTLSTTAPGYSNFISTITAINGNTLTLAGNVPNTVSGIDVKHDDSQAVQNAVNSCPANQVVYFPAGTYNLSSPIYINQNPVVLRGAGPGATILLATSILFSTSQGSYPSGFNTTPAAFSKGQQTITVTSTAGLQAGQIIVLDQPNDPSFVNPAGNEGLNSGGQMAATETQAWGGSGRVQIQVNQVTAINGNTVTLDTPVTFTGQSQGALNPRIWWLNYYTSRGPAQYLNYAGVEHMTINGVNGGDNWLVNFMMCANCWVKGVEFLNPRRAAIGYGWWSYRGEFRDNYFSGGTGTGPGKYSIELDWASSSLVENNIINQVGPIVTDYPVSGNVIGFNYIIPARDTWQWSGIEPHISHTFANLYEGNVTVLLTIDNIWGSGSNDTVFRNRLTGYQPTNQAYNNRQCLCIEAQHLYESVMGNVLGYSGFTIKYQSTPEVNIGRDKLIYSIGLWNAAGGVVHPPGGVSSIDTGAVNTLNTLYRWGNYDVVNGSTQWDINEVPADVTTGLVGPPESQLPASLYYPDIPSWWATPWGNPAWPPIGPGVTGGSDPSAGSASGMVDQIPAQLCFNHQDLINGGTFNPAACYPNDFAGFINLSSMILGDVNGDEQVTLRDAELAAKYACGLSPGDFNPAAADVSGNGTITLYDAALIARYAMGLMSKFPVQNK